MSVDSDADTGEFRLPPVPPRPESGSSRVQVEFGGLSHQGRVRPNNEDHFLVARFDRTMSPLRTNLPAGTVPESYAETVYGMLVADGMGGAAAGEVASRTAISALMDLVLETPDWIMRLDEERARQVLRRLEQRFARIRETLVERARTDSRLSGMGTTLTLACSLGAKLMIAHLGDSRVYLFRDAALRQLTRDQTVAQALADAGAIRAEDVPKHHTRHILTGALSTKGSTAPVELHQLQLLDGDQILLCTDGLTEMVAERDISGVLTRRESAEAACRRLVDLALSGGGKDNVTVVLGRYRLPEV